MFLRLADSHEMIIGYIGVCPLTHVGTSTSKESGPIHAYTILIYIDIY